MPTLNLTEQELRTLEKVLWDNVFQHNAETIHAKVYQALEALNRCDYAECEGHPSPDNYCSAARRYGSRQ